MGRFDVIANRQEHSNKQYVTLFTSNNILLFWKNKYTVDKKMHINAHVPAVAPSQRRKGLSSLFFSPARMEKSVRYFPDRVTCSMLNRRLDAQVPQTFPNRLDKAQPVWHKSIAAWHANDVSMEKGQGIMIFRSSYHNHYRLPATRQ